MNVISQYHFPRERGALSGEVLSPSDLKIIRMDDWRRDRLRLHLAPTLAVAVWMIPGNDPNPPSSPAAAMRKAGVMERIEIQHYRDAIRAANAALYGAAKAARDAGLPSALLLKRMALDTDAMADDAAPSQRAA